MIAPSVTLDEGVGRPWVTFINDLHPRAVNPDAAGL
jgi:hypothetical protein